MINIEILYSEYMNLYGDTGNIMYLKKCLNKAKFIYTHLNDKPKFITNKIDMIYLGPCTENAQEEIIKLLKPYKKNIKKLIDQGVIILAIGNALEIFGKYIKTSDNKKIEGLGLFDVYAKRIANYRHNELCLGVTCDGLEMVGFKNQMSHLYGHEKNYFQDMFLGKGRNLNTNIEGIRVNNFIGTYLLGPLLVLNPYFTKQLLKELGIKDNKLYLEEDAIKAYEFRLNEYKHLLK
jgi:lipid II isoglutaminyl synthase (glutamine-hydrolysing)